MDLLSFLKSTPLPFGMEQDVQSLVELHNAAYPVLFRYIAFRVGDKAAAEQLTEQLFTILLEEPARSKDSDFPHRLLLTLATKAVRTYQGSGQHMSSTALPESKIQACMAELPEEQQIVLALRYGCSLSIDQVAEALNKTPEAARHLQARAVITLHQKMQCP